MDGSEGQEDAAGLERCFADLSDPRVVGRCDHLLLDVIAISLLAVMCGAEDWPDVEQFAKSRAEWWKTFLELPCGIPSHDAFRRVFAKLDRQEFAACLFRWTQALHEAIGGKVVAIDGKAMCSARSPFSSTPFVPQAGRVGDAASGDGVRRFRRQAQRGPARVASPASSGLPRRSASTGASRTLSTGFWTWHSRKALAVDRIATGRRTSPPCVVRH